MEGDALADMESFCVWLHLKVGGGRDEAAPSAPESEAPLGAPESDSEGKAAAATTAAAETLPASAPCPDVPFDYDMLPDVTVEGLETWFQKDGTSLVWEVQRAQQHECFKMYLIASDLDQLPPHAQCRGKTLMPWF